MKTIKNETYKGYEIEVKAEFKEGTSAQALLGQSLPTVFFDSIKLQLTASKFVSTPPIIKRSRVEEEQSKRQALYDAMNSEVDIMIASAKEEIDKKEREKEMTDRLPESLLEKSNNSKLNQLYYMNKLFGVAPSEAEDILSLVGLITKESAHSIGNTLKSVLSRLEEKPNITFNLESIEGSSTREAHSFAKEITERLSKIDFK